MLAVAWPPDAWAHGPTVRVSYGGVKPPRIAIHAGQTVHFHNANSFFIEEFPSAKGRVVVAPPR